MPRISTLALATAIWGLVTPAAAANVTVTFSFDNIAPYTLGQGYTSAQISTYMSQVLQDLGYGANLVTVTGAVEQMGTTSYAGEGYVVGPKIGGTVYPLTLASTNGSVNPNHTTSQWDNTPNPTMSPTDGFITNCTSVYIGQGCTTTSDNIYMTFKNLDIIAASFNFEIFPNGECPGGSSGCTTLPDLTFSTTKGGPVLGHWNGVAPGTDFSGTPTYQDSLNHPNGNETAPQFLSTTGGLIPISGGTSTLDWADWPNTIGIDKLKIQFYVPEPPTIAMLAFGFIGLAWAWTVRRKRARRNRLVAVDATAKG